MTGAAEFGGLGGGVDIDLLADYIGGALTGTPDESVVATLITDDPAWRDAYRELSGGMAAVGAELGRLPSEPMPDELAARLEALFTSPIAEPKPIPAELAAPPVPHLTAVRGADASGDGAHDVGPRKTRVSPARRMRWATPIAIAAGVVAFAGFGLDYLAGRGGSADQATNSSAGLAESQARDDSAGGGAPLAPTDVRIFDSGLDYTQATLANEPSQPLAAANSGETASKQSAPQRASDFDLSALARLRVRSALQECLDAIQREHAAGPISAQSVDYARYHGAPAVVVRFTTPDGGLLVWASGSSCGTTSAGADTLATLPVR